MLADEVLAEQAKHGEMRAFEELVKRHKTAVYFAILRISQNPLEAEDILQDVFMSAFKYIQRFDPNKARFKTWLFGIVRSRCIDAFRKSKPQDSLTEELADTLRNSYGINDDFAVVELEQTVKTVLLSLSEEQRLCLILKTVGELDYREIAEIMSVPVGTVKSRVSAARRILARQVFHQNGSDDSCNAIK